MAFRVIAQVHRQRQEDAEAYDQRTRTTPVQVDSRDVDRAMARLEGSPEALDMLAEDAWTQVDQDGELKKRPPEPMRVGLLRMELARAKAETAAAKRSLALQDETSVVALRVGSRGLLRCLLWAVKAWLYARAHRRRLMADTWPGDDYE